MSAALTSAPLSEKCHGTETETGVAMGETTEDPQVTEDQHVTRDGNLHDDLLSLDNNSHDSNVRTGGLLRAIHSIPSLRCGGNADALQEKTQ